MPISYPHIRTLAEAAAHNAVGFAANLILSGIERIGDIIDRLLGRFPQVPLPALQKIAEQGQRSVAAAQTMQGTQGGPALPGSQLGINPASHTAYEYVVDVTMVIRPRRGPARVRTYRISVRSGVALDPDTVTLRAELIAEAIPADSPKGGEESAPGVTTSSTIVQANVRGQI